jgi:acetoacetate decarboxylase
VPSQQFSCKEENTLPITGQLTKAKMGYSMPVDAPLYEPFPLFYEDTRILLFPYLTDAKRAAALVPAPLDVVTVDPEGTLALAEMIFARYPFSNIGAYNEVAQTVAVTYKGETGAYAVRLHVTNDQALTAGREIGGFPKKMGAISFVEGEVFASALECPAGVPVCSAEMAPLQPIPWLTELPVTYFSLRVIPNPEDVTSPSLTEIVRSVWKLEEGRFWSARGTVAFSGASSLNPYDALPVEKALGPMSTAPPTGSQPPAPGLSLFRGNMRVTDVGIVERL